VKINFHEYVQIAKDIKSAGSMSDAGGYLFKQPGWRPDDKD
jgi:hypothetical protein